jgi:8-oxo-dGTP diphosphatase
MEVVVVHRPAYDDWSFPKGKLHDGESELDAALREVEEEIGVACSAGNELGTLSYHDSRMRPKTVRYWAMTLADGATISAANEVDEARWVDAADADSLLTYRHDRELFDRVRTRLLAVTRVFLVRHGSATDREHWSGPDDRRPLTEEGRLQADALAEALADQPFAHLLSSPFLRCVQTFAPLAKARGMRIEPRDELAEGRPPAYVEELVLEAAKAGPAALCVHGEAMRHLVGKLFDRGAAMTGDRDDHAKGGAWVLEVRDRTIATGLYIPPPLV